jgi:hypothetical protein
MHHAISTHTPLTPYIRGPDLFIKETKYIYYKYLEFPHHFSGHLGVEDYSAIH